MNRKLFWNVEGESRVDTVHKDYLGKETGKRQEDLRVLDWADMRNKTEWWMQAVQEKEECLEGGKQQRREEYFSR